MKLFVSYSSKNRDTVREVASDLESLGCDVWFDPALSGGREWWKDICAAIRECDVFVFGVTQDSLDSYPCQLEYTYANDLKKRVLPVLLFDVSLALLPKTLQKIQVVDYRMRDKQQLAALGRALLKLPTPEPMPDDILEPEAPLNAVTDIVERINGALLTTDQKSLLVDLEVLLSKEDSADEAFELLQSLSARKDDLLVGVYQRVKKLIGQHKAARQRGTNAAASISNSADNQPTLPDWQLKVFEHRHAVRSVAFSPDGQSIVTGSWDRMAHLWEIASGKERWPFAGHSGLISSVMFSPDSQYILTGSWDGTARLWDAANGNELQRFASIRAVISRAVFSPDGQYVLTGSEDAMAYLWETATGNEVQRFVGHTEPVSSVAFSPDGKSIVTSSGGGDCVARLWETITGKLLREFRRQQAPIYNVAFTPDAEFIVTSSADKTVRLWDIASGESKQVFSGHKDSVFSLAFSPDGRYIVTGSADKTARLWDRESGEEIRRYIGHSDSISGVAFSPDGTCILTGSKDRTARLWTLDGLT